ARRDCMRTAARMAELEAFCEAGHARRRKAREQRQLPPVETAPVKMARLKTGAYHGFKMAGDLRTVHRLEPLA
ncbi:MAG: hypothetical protein ACPG43_12545, partial [Alcanivoracaceae bacterium]